MNEKWKIQLGLDPNNPSIPCNMLLDQSIGIRDQIKKLIKISSRPLTPREVSIALFGTHTFVQDMRISMAKMVKSNSLFRRKFVSAACVKPGAVWHYDILPIRYGTVERMKPAQCNKVPSVPCKACGKPIQAIGTKLPEMCMFCLRPTKLTNQGRIKPTTSFRKCMKCKSKFKSEGNHNRLCEDCRHLNAGLQAHPLFSEL